MYTVHNTDAFVLGYRNSGGDDRGFHLFTKDFGLIYGVAKSVRKEKSKNRHSLTLGGKVKVDMVRGRSGWKIIGASALGVGEGFSLNNRLMCAYLFQDIKNLMVYEEPSQGVFELLNRIYESELFSDFEKRHEAVAELFRIMGYWSEGSGFGENISMEEKIEKIRSGCKI